MYPRVLAVLSFVAVAACAGSNTEGGNGVAIDVPEIEERSDVDDDPFTPVGSVDTVPGSAATTSPSGESTSTTSTSTTSTTSTSTTTTSSTTTIPPVPDVSPCPPTGSHIWVNRPASTLAPPPLPDGWRTDSAGASVAGRDLTLLVREVDSPARTVLVIGGIHGNEPVSPPTVRGMVEATIPDDTEVWLLPLLNPDGSAAGTRCNSVGVDLNRNFSWTWRADDGGPAPFSEPEPQAARALVERLGPDLVVWVHQPLGYVSSIGDTPDTYEQAWSAASGVPVRPDVTQHGGGESWTAFDAGTPSMLIEIDSWEATADIVDAHVAGFDALLDVVVPVD